MRQRSRRSFLQLLDAMRAEKGMLWADDRFVSAIENPRFRTVTTVEVLGALERYGRIPSARKVTLRQRLRAARYQFLGVECGEIVSLLREATSGGEVVDTSDLATLRHHVGEFLLHRRRLQWPAAPEADQGLRGEVPYLLDNGHAVVQALAAIWGDESWSLDDATAASGWILDHLELGLFPLPLLGPGDPRSDQLIGTHLGGLILAALQVQPGAGSNERQQAYLSWLYGEVVRNSLSTNLPILHLGRLRRFAAALSG